MHLNSPWLGRIIEQPPARQTCLYTVMPLYQGELLESRIARRHAIGLQEGRNIAIKLARCVAALHRVGVVHRDIKPDNVILESEGSLKLIDFGVVRVLGLEDSRPEDIPGTPAYMAPEMFDGEPGNEATDIYALGVTIFRAFAGEYPYGNIDATSAPRPADAAVCLAPGSSHLGPGRAQPGGCSRSCRTVSRYDRICDRDGGGTIARPGCGPAAADALRTQSGSFLARCGRSARVRVAAVTAAAVRCHS
jgi:serine/threonine protein kinase